MGRFILDGIPPAPRGVPQVEVTFDIDASGILSVKAQDKASGKEQSIKITGSTGLSKEEVEKMTKEAEVHAVEDAEKKEKVEAHNQADSLIFQAEKALKDNEGKVDEAVKTEVEEKVKALKDILETGSKEDLETKTKDLSDSLQKIGEAMYQKQEAQGQGDQQPETEGEAKSENPTEEAKNEEQPVEGEVVE